MALPTRLRDLPLRHAATGACVLMVALIALFQFVLTPQRQAPTDLFLLFTGLWAFGAVMLQVAPRFGAAGTAAWGFASAAGLVRMHLRDPGDYVLLAGSLLAAALAVALLVQLARAQARERVLERERDAGE